MSSTTVPAGHEVRLFGRTLEPFIGRTPGGLLVASTGRGGDDQESEVASMLEGLAAQVQPRPVVINAEIARLDELFAPAPPVTQTVESAAAVYFQKGSLAGLTDKALAHIADRLRDLGRRTKLFVALEPTDDVVRIAPMLTKAGIPPRLAAPDGTIAVEVRRPDGAVVIGVVATPLGERAQPVAAAPEATDLLLRSPRFDALVLDVVQDTQARTRRALMEYLKARTAPLALIATPTPTGELAIQPRHWPGKQAFVAYGDERSLQRAARELGHQRGSYAVAAMPPSKLFRWAASIDMIVMLCAFEGPADGTGEAWHVPLEVADLQRLAP